MKMGVHCCRYNQLCLDAHAMGAKSNLEHNGLGRLKASVERLHRLTQGFTDTVLTTFSSRAHKLGRALGIDSNVIDVSSLKLLPVVC